MKGLDCILAGTTLNFTLKCLLILQSVEKIPTNIYIYIYDLDAVLTEL